MANMLSVGGSKDQSQNMAILASVSASLLVALTVIATRSIVDRLDPLLLGFLRYGPAGILLTPLIYIHAKRIEGKDWVAMIVLGAMFYGIYPWLFSAALRYTTALHAALVLTLLPVCTLLIGVYTRTERLQPTKIYGNLLGICGVVVAFSESLFSEMALPENALVGGLIMLVAVILGAVFNVSSKRYVERYSALAVTTVCMASGGVILLVIVTSTGLLTEIPSLTGFEWSIIAFLSLGGALIGNLLWICALGVIAPSRVAIFALIPPVLVALLGALLLYEFPSIFALSGLCLVLLGILISQLGRH